MILYNRDNINIEIVDPVLDSNYYGVVTNLIRNDPYYLTADFIIPYQEKVNINFTGATAKNYQVSIGKSLKFEFVQNADIVLSKEQLADKYMEVSILENGLYKGGFVIIFTIYAIFLYTLAYMFYLMGQDTAQIDESRWLVDNIDYPQALTTVFGKPYSFTQIAKWPNSTYREILMQLINDSLKNPGTRQLLITLIQALGFVAYVDNIRNMRLWYMGVNIVNDNNWQIEPYSPA